MPLSASPPISYTRAADGLSITATDLTGAYNATTNLTGYGAPNPAATYPPFVSSVISVYMPDPETLLPTTTAITIDVASAFPSAVNGTFSITNVLLGLSATTVLKDGVWKFIWTQVYDDGGEQTQETTTQKVLYQVVECCIDNQIIEAIGCCDHNEEQYLRWAIAKLYLGLMVPRLDDAGEVIESVIDECGQYNKAATMLLELQEICDNENCAEC